MKEKNNPDNEHRCSPHPSFLIPPPFFHPSVFASLPWLIAGITPKDACAPAEPRPSFAVRISGLAGLPDAPFVHGSQPHGNAIAFVEKASLPADCRVHAIDGVDALITPDVVSFACYLPVVLFVYYVPMTGMFMIPKTVAYLAAFYFHYRTMLAKPA